MRHKNFNYADLVRAGRDVAAPVLSELHTLASSDNKEICVESCKALAVLADPGSQAALFEAMRQRPRLLGDLIPIASEFRTPEMLAFFTDMLWSDDIQAETKSSILDHLGFFESPSVVTTIEQFARHDDPLLRQGAARGLRGQKTPEAEALLQRMLEDEDRDVVTQALVSLRECATELSVPAIEQTLTGHRDPFVRSAALGSLGRIGLPSSIELIQQFLKDSDARIRASAIEALGSYLSSSPDLIRQLIGCLKDENNRVRANAIVLLYHYAHDESMDALASLIGSPRKTYRASAAFCVGEIQFPDVLAKLLPLVTTEVDPTVINRVVEAIGKLNRPRLKPSLLKLAVHPNKTLRACSIKALAGICTIDDTTALFDNLRAETDPGVKAELIRVLGNLVDDQSVIELFDYLNDRDEALVIAALDSLALAQQSSAVPLVAGVLQHPSADIRSQALLTLLKLGKLEYREELLRQLRHNDSRFLCRGIAAAAGFFHVVCDLKTQRPALLLEALEEHFKRMNAHGEARIRQSPGLAAPSAGSDTPKDRTKSQEFMLASILSDVIPLSENPVSEKLKQYARQNPSDYIAAYLDLAHNVPETERKIDEKTIQRFKDEHFMPGLFLALDHLKNRDDKQKLFAHYLEMASVEIRILLEFINRAMRYVKEKNDLKAAKMLEFLFTYLRLSPDIHGKFGTFFLIQKDYDLAFEHLKKAFAVDPDDLDLLLKLCGAATRLGKFEMSELLASTVENKAPEGSDVKKRAAGMRTIIAELRKGANPDRRHSTGPVSAHPDDTPNPDIPLEGAPPPGSGTDGPRTALDLQTVESDTILEVEAPRPDIPPAAEDPEPGLLPGLEDPPPEMPPAAEDPEPAFIDAEPVTAGDTAFDAKIASTSSGSFLESPLTAEETAPWEDPSDSILSLPEDEFDPFAGLMEDADETDAKKEK